MAKIIENPKGFKVIEISRSELVGRLAEYGSVGICDSCGSTDINGFYIAVLNQWFCPKCYEEWMKRAVYYHEDADFENSRFELYKDIFEL